MGELRRYTSEDAALDLRETEAQFVVVLVWSVLLLLSAAAPAPSEVPTRVSPEVVAERVKACGFEHVRVRNDPTLDEDVMEVSGVSEASEVKMRCVAQVSLNTITYVQFPEPMNQAYQRLYFMMADEQDRADARAWLQKRGLLDKVPIYHKGKSDILSVARQVEDVCGPKARGLLVPSAAGMTMKLGPPERPGIDDATFECLLNAISASGMPFGFVGNEIYQEQ